MTLCRADARLVAAALLVAPNAGLTRLARTHPFADHLAHTASHTTLPAWRRLLGLMVSTILLMSSARHAFRSVAAYA